jgi:hypothetical protein
MTSLSIALVLALALAGPASAQEVMTHSGIILDADERAGTLVLGEVGPWKLRAGATVITRLTIVFTPETEFTIAFRAEEPASGFPNDFVEAPIDPAGVFVGDHVTILCRHDGARLVALKLTVTDLPAADY